MKKTVIISAIVFFLDRIIKVFISNNFALNIKNKIINNFFYITYCHNDGAAFSLFSGNVAFLILLTIIILFFMYYLLKKKKNMSNIMYISCGILIGGILGNLFDRIFLGYVIDYLDFIVFNLDFAVFNLADVCIIVGAILVVLFEGSDSNDRRNKDRSN